MLSSSHRKSEGKYFGHVAPIVLSLGCRSLQATAHGAPTLSDILLFNPLSLLSLSLSPSRCSARVVRARPSIRASPTFPTRRSFCNFQRKTPRLLQHLLLHRPTDRPTDRCTSLRKLFPTGACNGVTVRSFNPVLRIYRT